MPFFKLHLVMVRQEQVFFQGILDKVGIQVETTILIVMILCVISKKGMCTYICVYR